MSSSSDVFENEDHEKAWFIRVTINACTDLLRSFFRRHTVSIDEIEEPSDSGNLSEDSAVRSAVPHCLPNTKMPSTSHYYEGYTAAEIASLLGKKKTLSIRCSHAPGSCSAKNSGAENE